GSPVPSGPSAKDSDQEGETEVASNCTSPTTVTEPHLEAGGDARTGDRLASEGNENEVGIVDGQRQERLMQQGLQLSADDAPE
ncbi:hypothetical protein BIW11_11454, partial [Tropilaelaps mercedesae]